MTKEITIKLEDHVAERISKSAQSLGISSAELIKYVLGSYRGDTHSDSVAMTEGLREMGNLVEKIDSATERVHLSSLKHQARMGSLKCSNCTVGLSEQDVINGKCSACSAPITD